MKFLKLLLGAVFLAVIGYVGLSIATNRGMVNAQYLDTVNAQLKNVKMPTLSGNPTQVLEQAQKVVSESKVSESLKVEPSKPPVTQQAFEYVRYNYCQAVVKDYEGRYSAHE